MGLRVPDGHLPLQECSEVGELFGKDLILRAQELKFGSDLCVGGDELLGLCLKIIDVIPLTLSKATRTFPVFGQPASFAYHLFIIRGEFVTLGIVLDFRFFGRRRRGRRGRGSRSRRSRSRRR